MTIEPKVRALPQAVWILGFASLFTDVSSEMIHSVLPLFLVSTLNTSASIVGLIDGFAETLASVLKLFSGALSDHFGRRKPLLIAGYTLSALVKPLFAVAQNPAMVLLARSLDRTGKGIRAAPRDALVADVTDEHLRGAAYGLRQALDSVGAFVGPAVALVALSYTNNDYRFVFWLALIPGVLTILLLAIGIQEPNRHAESKDTRPRLNWQSIKDLGRPFWLVFAVAVIFTLGNSSDAFILLRAKELGVTPNFVPMALVVINVVYSATAYPAGKLSDHIGRKTILLVSFALYATVYAGFALAENSTQIWCLMALYGLYLGLSQGTLLALTADRVPQTLRGTAFGFINLSIGIGLLPASLMGGFLWDTVSSSATFWVGSAFALIAFLLLLTDQHRPSAAEKS
ncbi:MAG: MFS transporter [Candidatus Obscuribacterales bacterium]|nr:MFS transporter [Candidatus Obscuribacterales bacterium]